MRKLTEPLVPLKDLDGLSIAFGQPNIKWPSRHDPILNDVDRHFQDIANSLFFSGGKLSDHNLQLKEGVNSSQFYGMLQAVLASFEPPHEVKKAVAGSFLECYTEKLKD